MDTTRIIIAIVLSFGLIFLYQELVLKRLYPPPTETTTGPMPTGPVPGLSPMATSSAAAAGHQQLPAPPGNPAVAIPSTTARLPGSVVGAPEKLIEVDTNLWHAQFTSQGARLRSFKLKQYRETASADSPWYEMVRPSPGASLPLGVIVAAAGKADDDRLVDYSTASAAQIEVHDSRDAKLTFVAKIPNGLGIEKTFTFTANSYVLGMAVKAMGPAPLDALGVTMNQPLTARAGYYDVPELQADVEGKVITESEKALRKGPTWLSGKLTYAGFGDRYFLSVFLPQLPTAGTLKMEYFDEDAGAWLLFPKTSTLKTSVLIGPKKLEVLEAANPALNKAIDFGWTGMLALAFLRALKLFHRFAPNWGWDIILLTVGLRVLILPMSIKSQRSMTRMQHLQPQMERIRNQFKDDPERQQREMVDLYKRNHVNPLGGCLPMAIQLPIFIGLYEALLNAVELRHASFMWWIKDLSAPDCFPVSWMPRLPLMHCHGIPVLVLLMGVSTYLQQWMMPSSPDPNQQRMMMLTPIIFTVMFVNFPAGLSLYYFASNVLGVAQQIVLNREFKQSAPVT